MGESHGRWTLGADEAIMPFISSANLSVQTICGHGDPPGAERIVRAVREGLEKAGCQVKPLGDWLPAH